ncbi:hypothetical protein [Chitinophaga rhizophila]|uniref:Uncharacterized protein n=1 Tax=Chitinophaga rhizophila TaxID=2866212 RepID=A0ABS7GF72_9BACT|nr:hypothetical protein [Chitinophaga rhizophila]MBW8686329.1 hypothetical protein [Chitinophaga rhizophila]
MKQISWRRMSVLGIVLMGASAVTAAVLPNKTEARDSVGSLTQSTANGLAISCTVTGSVGAACNVTAGTLTTVGTGADAESIAQTPQTANNTTTF